MTPGRALSCRAAPDVPSLHQIPRIRCVIRYTWGGNVRLRRIATRRPLPQIISESDVIAADATVTGSLKYDQSAVCHTHVSDGRSESG